MLTFGKKMAYSAPAFALAVVGILVYIYIPKFYTDVVTFDYNERTALFSMRDGALIAGTVVAAAMPGAVRWTAGLDGSPAGERITFFILSLIYIPLILGACA